MKHYIYIISLIGTFIGAFLAHSQPRYTVAYAQQDPDSPLEHPEPPKGWFCSGDDPRPDHKCTCANMPKSKDDEACTSQVTPIIDPMCRTYCHEDHCACSLACETMGGKEHK